MFIKVPLLTQHNVHSLGFIIKRLHEEKTDIGKTFVLYVFNFVPLTLILNAVSEKLWNKLESVWKIDDI